MGSATPSVAPAVAEGFAGLLAGFDLEALARHEGTIVGVDRELRIGYLNAAWFRFAAENGGEPAVSQRWALGTSLWTAIAPELEPYFRRLFDSAFAAASPPDPHPLTHEYECSSAEEYRRFALNIYPLRGGQGLLLMHSLRVQREHGPGERPSHAPDLSRYVDDQGMIRQCSHCRRIQLPRSSLAWHWVPDWVRKPPANTSHGLCQVCFDYYYPDVTP